MCLSPVFVIMLEYSHSYTRCTYTKCAHTLSPHHHHYYFIKTFTVFSPWRNDCLETRLIADACICQESSVSFVTMFVVNCFEANSLCVHCILVHPGAISMWFSSYHIVWLLQYLFRYCRLFSVYYSQYYHETKNTRFK